MPEAGQGSGEIADKLFDDVLQCQQAENVAVFIDDKADPLAVFLEKSQLRENCRASRYVVWGLQLRHQGGFVEFRVAKAGEQASYRQYADELVERFATGRQAAVMTGRQLRPYFVPGKIKVED